jgi:hypothetical protein
MVSLQHHRCALTSLPDASIIPRQPVRMVAQRLAIWRRSQPVQQWWIDTNGHPVVSNKLDKHAVHRVHIQASGDLFYGKLMEAYCHCSDNWHKIVRSKVQHKLCLKFYVSAHSFPASSLLKTSDSSDTACFDFFEYIYIYIYIYNIYN